MSSRERIDNLLRHREVCAKLCGQIFRSADTEGRGALGWEQAKELGAQLCSRLGTPGISEPQFKAVFEACDEDEDGLLGMEEFSMLFEVYLRLSLGMIEERDRRRAASGLTSGQTSPVTSGSPLLQPVELRTGGPTQPTHNFLRVFPPKDGLEEVDDGPTDADAASDDVSTHPPMTERSLPLSLPSESDRSETQEIPGKTAKPTSLPPPVSAEVEPAVIFVPSMMMGLLFLLLL